MAAAGGYSLSISAVDNATAVLDRINKRMQSVQAPVVRMNRALSRLGENLGLSRVANSVGEVSQQANGAWRSLSRMVPPIEALAGAASLAGVAKLTSNFANFGRQLTFTSRRAGMTASQLQILENSGRLAGTSAEAVASGMQTLGDNMVNAVGGRAPEVVSLLNTLGISMKNADGSTRKAADILPEFSDKMVALKNPTLQARAANILFGGSAEELLRWLRLGSKGIADNSEKAKHYGIITHEARLNAIKFAIAQTELTLATEGLGNTIGAELMPVMTPMLHGLAEWIAANKDLIASNVSGVVKQIGDAIKGIDWTDVWKSVQNVGREINAAVGYLGGWKKTAEEVVVLMAGTWLARMMGPLLQVGKTLFYLGMLSPTASAALGFGAAVGIATDLALKQNGIAPSPTGDWPLVAPGGPITPQDMANGVLGLPGQLYRSARDFLVGPSFDTKMTPEARALLDTIAGPESGGDYSRRNGRGHITDFSHFPGGIGPGGTSTAAGRYQDIQKTWDEEQARLNLPDFSPASQDRGNWDLAQRKYYEKTGRYLANDVKNPDAATRVMITGALKDTWPSMPGGSQQLITQDNWNKNLATNMGQEARVPQAMSAPVMVQPSGDPVNIAGGTGSAQAADPGLTVRGSADVRVSLSGVPQGTKVAASTDGNLFGMPQVNVATAMPGAGY